MKTKIEKSKKGIEDLTTEKATDKNLPGYPHYPPVEDIMNKENHFKKLPLEEEVNTGEKEKPVVVDETDAPIENQIDITDITAEDLKMLDGAETIDGDMAATDLDIPGAELDDEMEATGNEDEENNSYSIGGDRHEDLEEENEAGR